MTKIPPGGGEHPSAHSDGHTDAVQEKNKNYGERQVKKEEHPGRGHAYAWGQQDNIEKAPKDDKGLFNYPIPGLNETLLEGNMTTLALGEEDALPPEVAGKLDGLLDSLKENPTTLMLGEEDAVPDDVAGKLKGLLDSFNAREGLSVDLANKLDGLLEELQNEYTTLALGEEDSIPPNVADKLKDLLGSIQETTVEVPSEITTYALGEEDAIPADVAGRLNDLIDTLQTDYTTLALGEEDSVPDSISGRLKDLSAVLKDSGFIGDEEEQLPPEIAGKLNGLVEELGTTFTTLALGEEDAIPENLNDKLKDLFTAFKLADRS